MKVSLNAIRFNNQHYGSAGDPAPEGIEQLVAKIGSSLGAVEEVIPFGDKYEGAIIVRVASCQKHPNADKLNVCKIDDGGKAQNVERDENGHVQVVCGAPNVREGMVAVWLPPGVTVPNTYFDIDSFVLGSRELRGVLSNGMLASPKELALSDSHEGILDITDHPDQHGVPQPGTLFADAYNLREDKIIDMENKMFTHRPDCFGYLGVAREIEGINHRPYKSPEWYRLNPEIPSVEADELKLELRNELPQQVRRFNAITLRGVEVKESPVWLQLELARVGIRPINNIVDYTNFFMIETGQPLHAYDYDKVAALSGADHAVITVRRPQEGEKLTLLGGKEVEPTPQTILIATDKQPIGIGGVMGGAETEVGMDTRNIIIECANFDMYSVRRTSMALGLFTDAVTRFTKGQSPLQTKAVLAKIVDEIRAYAGGKVASPLVDDNHLPEEVMARGSLNDPIEVGQSFINERLGLKLSTEAMSLLLRNVEFDVSHEADVLTVTAPFWRTDIAIPEDIVEEVGRLYGYEYLPLELPQRSSEPTTKDAMLQLKSDIRAHLAASGANELLTYSFVHGDLLKKTGQDPEKAYRLSNALSPDLQYYRLSLTPSLLDKVHPNIKAGHSQFALFEVGKAHIKGFEEEGLPKEFERIALVYAADAKAASAVHSGAPYYQARKYLMDLLAYLGVGGDVTFEPLNGDDDVATTYYASGRAATIKVGGQVVGRVGEYKSAVRKALKLPDYCAGFELGLQPLLGNRQQKSYIALSRFPKVEQDICLKVTADLPYVELFQFVWQHLDENRPDQTYHDLSPVDIYQREDDQAHKQITLRLHLASYERTLTDQEVNSLLDRVATAAKEKFNAERV